MVDNLYYSVKIYCGTEAQLGGGMYYLINPIINIPAPPSQNYPVAPLFWDDHKARDGLQAVNSQQFFFSQHFS